MQRSLRHHPPQVNEDSNTRSYLTHYLEASPSRNSAPRKIIRSVTAIIDPCAAWGTLSQMAATHAFKAATTWMHRYQFTRCSSKFCCIYTYQSFLRECNYPPYTKKKLCSKHNIYIQLHRGMATYLYLLSSQ